jgi:hypothetical protein
LNQNRRTFGVEIGYETGLGFEHVAGEDDGGVGHLSTVHPHSTLVMNDGGSRVRRRKRQRAQNNHHPASKIA